MEKKKVCLNMIVKDESLVIRRCLDSVKHLIDYWVIVDTGSKDGTQEIIREFLKEIPGELHERPWVNFGHNRDEAMQIANGKGDYLLFIDADDILIFSDDFVMPELEEDAYCITQREENKNVYREHHTFLFIKNDGTFKWEGPLHERLKFEPGKNFVFLQNVFNKYINDGNRSKDPNKISKDILILKDEIKKNPNDSRSTFYLAKTYWSIRDYQTAIKHFEKRAEMGGDPMEVYHSLLYIGISQRHLHYSPDVFIRSFCNAYLYRPTRAESLYELARYYADSKQFLLGYLISKIILAIPKTTDILFVESWVQDWGALLYFFVCASQIGVLKEAEEALDLLLSNPRLPQAIREDFKLDEWKGRVLCLEERSEFSHQKCLV